MKSILAIAVLVIIILSIPYFTGDVSDTWLLQQKVVSLETELAELRESVTKHTKRAGFVYDSTVQYYEKEIRLLKEGTRFGLE